MARQPRIHAPATWYHVFNRGTDRQDIFHSDPDRLAFEALLAETVDRSRIELHAAALMTNHFHLLVHAPEDSISAAMHRLCGSYASRYNRAYRRTGPLWSGRFRSVVVESDEQLLQVSRYIHRNPLSLVDLRALPAYRWSTYSVYTGHRRGPAWARTDVLLGLWTNGALETRVASYREFVEQPQPADNVPDLDATLNWDCDAVEHAVADVAGVAVDDLHRSRRRVENQPRLVAMLLMQQARLATAQDLADRFGLASQSSARSATSRARALLASDPVFRSLWGRSIAELRRAAA